MGICKAKKKLIYVHNKRIQTSYNYIINSIIQRFENKFKYSLYYDYKLLVEKVKNNELTDSFLNEYTFEKNETLDKINLINNKFY